jgi:DNA-binding transcriptional LysR family regulator
MGVNQRNSAVVSKQLGSISRRLCVSPQYLAQHGSPALPSDLKHHNCLAHLLTASDGIWRFIDGDREIEVKVRGNFMADSVFMLRKAVLAGRGMAILPIFCISKELQSGEVIEILPKFPVPAQPLVALFKDEQSLSSNVRLLIDYLTDWLERYSHSLQPVGAHTWPNGRIRHDMRPL